MKSGILAGMTAALLLSSAVARADVEISNKPTSNMSCVSGVCTATAQKAVLNVSDLATMLASGDVAVKTGSVAKDIDIAQPLQWTSTSRLTLDAQQSVTVSKQITVAGQGALTVVTNDTGGAKAKNKTGEFIIVPEHGSVQFWDLSSSLIIDGNSYTLVSDIKSLASDIAANPSGFYALAKPYDASVDGTYSSSPIANGFSGVFDGLGNNISNLTVRFVTDQTGETALFSRAEAGSTIRQLGVTNVSLTSDSGNIVGDVAGLVARNDGLIDHCWTDAVITIPAGQTASPGGLVGENGGVIKNSYSKAKIRMMSLLSTLGGLVGNNYGTVDESYVQGSVSGDRGDGTEDVGGLLGYNTGIVTNTFAKNSAHRRSGCCEALGGLVGKNDSGGRITSSYAAGYIKLPHSGVGYLGGLVGEDLSQRGNISAAYWDIDRGVSDTNQGAGNIKNDPGIVGLTTQQLQSGLPAGFDPKIWRQNQDRNGAFPYLFSVSKE